MAHIPHLCVRGMVREKSSSKFQNMRTGRGRAREHRPHDRPVECPADIQSPRQTEATGVLLLGRHHGQHSLLVRVDEDVAEDAPVNVT